MTDFTPSDLPPSVNTVERVLAWAAEVLSSNYPDVRITELLDNAGNPLPQRVAQSDRYYVSATNPGSWRLVVRVSLPLNPSFQFNGPVYKNIDPIGSVPTNAGFKT